MMNAVIVCRLLSAVFLLGVVPEPVPVVEPADPDPAYTAVIDKRARDIVDTLALDDADTARQVQSLIADQYRSLSMLLDTRDAHIKAMASQTDTPAAAEPAVQALKDMTQSLLEQLHTRYLLKLSALLTPAQVDRVKDGMTYGIVQVTYNSYLEMLPALTETQKSTIMAYLVEAGKSPWMRGLPKKNTAGSANTRGGSTITCRRRAMT